MNGYEQEEDGELRGLLPGSVNHDHGVVKDKFFNKWSLVGMGASVFVVTLLIISTAKPRDVSAFIQKTSSKSVKSGGHKIMEAIRTQYAKMSSKDHQKLFSLFKSVHSKKYSTTAEENERFQNFKSFLELIDTRNEEEVLRKGHTIHGITKFADLSPSEFRQRFLNYKPSNKASLSSDSKLVKGTYKVPATKKDSEMTNVDWSGIYTTDVKNQGYCGSCWAFSAVSQIESDSIRLGLIDVSQTLSEQQVVSCDTVDYGCSGGNTETAYQYVAHSGGLVSDTVYPYKSYMGQTLSCTMTERATEALVTVTGYQTIEGGEDAMIDYVLTTGPLSICLDASTWSSYASGIVSHCGNDIDHCVQVVGVNTIEGYWKVRNSWGTDWGDDGYIYLVTGKDICGITTDPTFVTPEKA